VDDIKDKRCWILWQDLACITKPFPLIFRGLLWKAIRHPYSFEVSHIFIFLSVSLLLGFFSVFRNIKINIEKAVTFHLPPCGFVMTYKYNQ